MKYVPLGNTGLNVSEVGFGCIPIIRLKTDEAVQVLKHAYEKGINFYDTANMYRDSEAKIGKAFAGMRDKVIIASKTLLRDADGAKNNLENSLKMLQTDYIDLYQFHMVSHPENLSAITGTNGALEVIIKAKEQGKIRHVGVTSHSLSMAIELVKTGLFETIQFPFNFIEDAAKNELHPSAKKSKMGIIVMKPLAGGVIPDAKVAFAFLRQFQDILPIPGFDSIQCVNEVVDLYQRPNELSVEILESMELMRKELGTQFCRRCEYCQPCPNGVKITPAMAFPIVAKRMSAKVAVEFSKPVMESVVKCTECGVCLGKCPYQLPIPEILKRNYALYQKYLTE
jgi:uncharacterized protein